jgi:beta-glucanase (GH16 family)
VLRCAAPQSYTSDPANVRVEGGALHISALKSPGGSVTSGRIHTRSSAAFVPDETHKNIRVEARIAMPNPGAGLWPAFWMLPRELKYGPWPASGE